MISEYSVIGLGSNSNNFINNVLENKLDNLSNALNLLKNHKNITVIKVASTYFSNAQLPENAPDSWKQDFFNTAVLIRTSLSPDDLLFELKNIEKKMGRVASPDWSPRIIDLDILFYGNLKINKPNLCLPHEHLLARPFALMPAYEIIPKDMRDYFFQDKLLLIEKIIEKYKDKNLVEFNTHKINQRIDNKKLMKIINITPDSFSENNINNNINNNIDKYIEKEIENSILDGAHIIDIGAEATNPNVKYKAIETDLEWSRLEYILKYIKNNKDIWANKYGVKISLDTRNYHTLSKALNLNSIDILNDVSGLRCDKMQNIIKDSGIGAVFMHSLSVPADKAKILSFNKDPVDFIFNWAQKHLDYLINFGISKDQLIFDPGIGFGNNSLQALEIIQRFDEFKKLGVKLLLGHSRKSWLNDFINLDNISNKNISNKNVSLDEMIREKDRLTSLTSMLNLGADILRVHNIGDIFSRFVAPFSR